MKHIRTFLFLFFLALYACSPVLSTGESGIRRSSRTIEVRGQQYYIHTVWQGETLYSIARAYGVSQQAIMESNGMNRDALRARQTLLIPHSDAPTAQTGGPTPVPGTGLQTVDPGPVQPNRPQDDFFGAVGIDSSFIPVQPAVAARIKDFDRNAPLEVAVMLPIYPGAPQRANDNFSDFYKGALLGLGSLKAEGTGVNIRFLSTGNSATKVEEHIRRGLLDPVNLIIGPVYAEPFEPVAEFAAREGIPVVSPLGAVGAENNPFVFEAAPPDEVMYDKLFAMLGRPDDPDKNFVIIRHQESADAQVLQTVQEHYSGLAGVRTMEYTGNRNQSAAMTSRLTPLLDREKENIVFVPVSQVSALEEVLSRLLSINSLDRYRIAVVGTPRWTRLDLNQELYFKLNAMIPVSYHADRTTPVVAEFYNEYIGAFGSVPSPYAFRGYDVTRYFVGAMKRYGTRMRDHVDSYAPQLLQVGYRYEQHQPDGKYRNVDWPVLHYRPDFTIEVR